MRLYLLICVTIIVSYNQCYSSHILVSGTVSGSWNVDTVLVTGNIQIASGGLLTIDPGTLVQFQGHFRFRVDGQLLALGTEADSILFSVNDTTGFSDYETGAGGWKGIWFYHVGPANDSTLFKYCKFEYGKAAHEADSADWYGGAICVREFNRLRISHCTFSNNRAYKNGGAVYARLANIKLDHCCFENNVCGQPTTLFGYGGGVCLEYSDAMIHRNYFTQNQSTGVGGGLSWEYSNPSVVANHFYNNYSAIGGGFVCLRSEGMRPVVNNLAEANSSLFFGGGIAVIQTIMPFTNNTVVNNFSGAGGGLYFNSSSFAVFRNCIVWDNYDLGGGGPQVYIWDTFSAPEFYYCDVEGGVGLFGGTGGGSGFIGIYESCLEINPDFIGSGDHPYQPSQNSVCVNNGTPDTTGLLLPDQDFAGMDRFLNNHIDIGAYETAVFSSIENDLLPAFQAKVYPNPFKAYFEITFIIYETLPVQIFLLNLEGGVTDVIENAVLSPGTHRYGLNITDDLSTGLADEVYFLKIITGQKAEVLKLVHKK